MQARPQSLRLRYEPLGADGLGWFQQLAVDPHIKRYLLDGETVTQDWCLAELGRSQQLFRERGVGLWLIRENGEQAGRGRGAAPIGFAGFRVFEEVSPEIQLLYAFLERVTGRGYATECGHALLRYASEAPRPGFDEMLAGVDPPNRASIRVLEKLGFAPAGSAPGEFGEISLFRWRQTSRGGGSPTI